jgi:hypothetical protein
MAEDLNEPEGESKEYAVLPEIRELLISKPLYTCLEFDPHHQPHSAYVRHLHQFDEPFDCHCVRCGSMSTFQRFSPLPRVSRPAFAAPPRSGISISAQQPPEHLMAGPFAIEFQCSRNPAHVLTFVFLLRDRCLIKIGQHPSLGDLATGGFEKYRKVLPGEDLREFKKAVGLASHDAGIGAFAYLRRVFERAIEEAHAEAQAAATSWDEVAFQRARVEERIGLLKGFLPELVVRNKALYGILSKGIHELTEKECLAAFPVVRTGLELILLQKVAERDQKQKVHEAEKAINTLRQQMKKPNGET